MLGLKAITNTVIIRADYKVPKTSMARVLGNVLKNISPTSVEQSNTDAPKRDEREKFECRRCAWYTIGCGISV